MARKTKAPTRRPTTKKKNAAKAKPKAGAGKRPSARGTEVERNWATYLRQRTALEHAVTAVQTAEAALTSAREIEAARRKEFDDSKQALEQLLAVEPAIAARPAARKKPLEFPAPIRKPAGGEEQEVTLG